jgi:glutaredoxin-like protein NrdH
MSITVWSKPNCVQCKAVYRALDREPGLVYEVKNLPDFPEKLAEFIEAGYTAAPVVEATGVDTFAGFNPDSVKAVIAQHRSTAF